MTMREEEKEEKKEIKARDRTKSGKGGVICGEMKFHCV
jgi:hypothetical protein